MRTSQHSTRPQMTKSVTPSADYCHLVPIANVMTTTRVGNWELTCNVGRYSYQLDVNCLDRGSCASTIEKYID